MAQYGTTPYQSGYTTSVSPLGRLSSEALQWMMAETLSQAQAPTALTELDLRIEKAVGEELAAAAGRERATKADLASAMRFEIVREAHDLMTREVRTRKQLEPELQRTAKRKRLSLEEVKVLVMYDVITGAAKKMDKAVRARRQEVEKAGIPDKQDPQLRGLGARKAGLLELIKELGPRMTSNTRLLTSAR